MTRLYDIHCQQSYKYSIQKSQLALNKILWFYIPMIFLTPCYTYYIAVTYKQQPPFPHATITSTSCYYPQDIIVRLIMITGSSFLTLVFFVVNRWLITQAQRTGFQPFSKSLYYTAQISIFCYCVTIATIDGKGTGSAHSINAVIFFVIWLITIMNMTIYTTKLYKWDTSIMSYGSLLLKQVIAGYVALVWIYCIVGLISQSSATNKQDIYVVIVQWNSVFGNLLWVLSFVIQWKYFKIGLVRQQKSDYMQIENL